MVQITETLFDMLASERDSTESACAANSFAASECAEIIFNKMDTNQDGKLTMDEFVEGCLEDENLYSILTSTSTIE